MRKIPAFLLLFALASCVSPQERARRAAEAEAAVNAYDDNKCQNFGLAYGSSAYANCRMQLTNLRAQEQLINSVNAANSSDAMLGAGMQMIQSSGPRTLGR